MRQADKKTDLTERAPRVLDLFAGAGGTGLGFARAGFRIVAAIEIDPYAAETYTRNLGVEVTRKDIRELDPSNFRETLNLEPGELEVLMGGPPCQGFSKMRNGKGNGDVRNDLVLTYIEYVKEFRPHFALLENVPGLIRSAHGREFYNELWSGLEALGYALVQDEIDVADYGVPQHRRRVLLVAGRDAEVPPVPSRTHGHPRSLEVKAGLQKPWRTVRDAIEKYPPVSKSDGNKYAEIYPNHVAATASEELIRYLRAVPKDGGSRTDIPKEMWLRCHLEHHGHLDVYGRAAWDRPSNTMTTGCTNPSKGRFVHPEQDRGFTAREAAALQGFPDTYAFVGIATGRQIGNAVPPPLAFTFAHAILHRLSGHATCPCFKEFEVSEDIELNARTRHDVFVSKQEGVYSYVGEADSRAT